MILKTIFTVLFCALASGVWAQSARVLADQSSISQQWSGRTTIELALTQGVPFRVFTLEDPARLVVDFRDLEAPDTDTAALLTGETGIEAIRFGVFQPGWVRLVADLTRPMLPDEIGMSIDGEGDAARLVIALSPAEQEIFAAKSGAPENTLWPMPSRPKLQQHTGSGQFVVVLDPGHGGIDPGAEREGLSEKELMLDFAFRLRDQLMSQGVQSVFLTREDDRFVSLDSRVAFAHQVAADVFISLHADALSEGGAKGATVYTLSDEASDAATAQLAARHNRTDLIAGLDLTDADSEVTAVLLDLARHETTPRSQAIARDLVAAISAGAGPVNNKPFREAGFVVLKSADIPSVLVEVGFLSNARDRKNIADPMWRDKMAAAMATGIVQWRTRDNARSDHLRQ